MIFISKTCLPLRKYLRTPYVYHSKRQKEQKHEGKETINTNSMERILACNGLLSVCRNRPLHAKMRSMLLVLIVSFPSYFCSFCLLLWYTCGVLKYFRKGKHIF